MIEYIYLKWMKKMCVVLTRKESQYKVCTDDLLRMYYYQRRRIPALPAYRERTDQIE